MDQIGMLGEGKREIAERIEEKETEGGKGLKWEE